MSTRAVHILDTIRGKLDDDAGFAVVKIYETEKYRDADKVRVYVNIISDDKLNDGYETGADGTKGAAYCGIYADWIGSRDTGKLGTGTVSYGDVVDRIEEAMNNLNDTLLYNPIVSTSTYFKTIIHGVQLVRVTGYVDDASTEGRLLYEVRVFYTQGAV